ncbi:hypothetical protein ACQ86D_39915 [Streptomyces galilaeus]
MEVPQHHHRPHPHGQLLQSAHQLVTAVDPSVLVTRRGRIAVDRVSWTRSSAASRPPVTPVTPPRRESPWICCTTMT